MTQQRSRQSELRWDPNAVDQKWQRRWAADGLHAVSDDDPRPKWYELTMYPYPSGDVHIGHWYAMAPSDAHARFRRMQGYNVLHPMGFDAFGLPAENAAIRQGVHPHAWTMANIEKMRGQLRSMGTVYDWDREIICCLPEYYRWNQWLFLQFYKAGLAYRAHAPAVWCPSCQTVLANEQVLDGACERCGTPITRRELDQWFLRITDYADQLLDSSGITDWPERILTMQRNWIGRSEGAEVVFDISHLGIEEESLPVFTTRVDTLFGVTFLVLAPEHPMVEALTAPEQRETVEAYVAEARAKSDIERMSTEREKTGVPLGTTCINPANGQPVPIWTADYAVAWYATGAVMGVPAHDHRDFEFATRFGLPIVTVIAPPGATGDEVLESAYVEPGTMVNSGDFNGMPNDRGADAIAAYLEARGTGVRTQTYRLRDWLVSRQRYWGTPIPIVHCPACGPVAVPEDELPVLLPQDADFQPTGESPLARNEAFVHAPCPQCGAGGHRETDTMDTFFDSSWYFLRYLSAKNNAEAWGPGQAESWAPVDQYTGGAEHAVMHLMYARFFVKALRDIGLLSFDEPFLRLYNQGHIIADGAKMSKSRGNVVAPDEYVSTLGADIVRTYLMFVGPWDRGGDWSDSGINGVARWYNRVWDIWSRDPAGLTASDDAEGSRELRRKLHQTMRKVYQDLDAFKFNTAVAAMMELTNLMQHVWEDNSASPQAWNEARRSMLVLLAPIAPHLAEELWERLGETYSVHQQSFPEWDDDLAAEELVTLVVQVDGRVRDRLSIAPDLGEDEAKDLAMSQANVQRHLEGKEVAKAVYVPGRLLNLVTR
ncbi:MAG: leucine--tRNA ligase [Chloroflexota bacterium]|nr:leucine--tRNA ligase [Chloroflexota bacterium]